MMFIIVAVAAGTHHQDVACETKSPRRYRFIENGPGRGRGRSRIVVMSGSDSAAVTEMTASDATVVSCARASRPAVQPDGEVAGSGSSSEEAAALAATGSTSRPDVARISPRASTANGLGSGMARLGIVGAADPSL